MIFFDVHMPANVLILTTLAVGVFALFKNWQCGAALLVSLMAARLLPADAVGLWHPLIMFFCAAVCLTGFGGKCFYVLDMERNEINYAVSFIYMFRISTSGVTSTGLVGTELLWIISMAFLLLQNLLIFGGCIGGYAKLVNLRITNFRFRADAVLFSR